MFILCGTFLVQVSRLRHCTSFCKVMSHVSITSGSIQCEYSIHYNVWVWALSQLKPLCSDLLTKNKIASPCIIIATLISWSIRIWMMSQMTSSFHACLDGSYIPLQSLRTAIMTSQMQY